LLSALPSLLSALPSLLAGPDHVCLITDDIDGADADAAMAEPRRTTAPLSALRVQHPAFGSPLSALRSRLSTLNSPSNSRSS
jgi:hypothetical protein